MASELMLVESNQFVSEYEGKTAAELREALKSLLTVSAETFARMAAIVQVADEEGVTDELGLQGYQVAALRRIGRGQVLPQAYAQFGGSPLECHLRRLSAAQQRDLCEGGGVPVYSFENGKIDKREVPPLKLTPFERRQVFGPNGIRDAAEQRSWLESQRKKDCIGPLPQIVTNKHRNVAIVPPHDKPMEITRKHLAMLLSELS